MMQLKNGNWELIEQKLELKYTWKISRNSSEFKINFIIKFQHEGIIGLGEVAPNIRYNETPESIKEAFHLFITNNSIDSNVNSLNWERNIPELPNALRFGIEQAWLHWFVKKNNSSVSHSLKITPASAIQTCYTLPIMEAKEMSTFYKEYQLQRFSILKIKVNQTQAKEEFELFRSISKQKVIIDANESWDDPDSLINFINEIKNENVALVEQPMPSSQVEAYKYIKPLTQLPIMADESVCREANWNELKQQFHGVNMKLMKAGGLIRGMQIIEEAKANGMITMTGCMIETTLGMRSAWLMASMCDYADLDGYMIIKKEPFEYLYESNGSVYLNDKNLY